MWLKYQGGGQRFRRPPPLCLSQDGPTWLPHQRHQVELHQVSHQQGGQASGKVGGRGPIFTFQKFKPASQVRAQ